jgi:hypothetical protein
MDILLEKLYIFIYASIAEKVYSRKDCTGYCYITTDQIATLTRLEQDLFDKNWAILLSDLAAKFAEKEYDHIVVSEKNIYVSIRLV